MHCGAGCVVGVQLTIFHHRANGKVNRGAGTTGAATLLAARGRSLVKGHIHGVVQRGRLVVAGPGRGFGVRRGARRLRRFGLVACNRVRWLGFCLVFHRLGQPIIRWRQNGGGGCLLCRGCGRGFGICRGWGFITGLGGVLGLVPAPCIGGLRAHHAAGGLRLREHHFHPGGLLRGIGGALGLMVRGLIQQGSQQQHMR